MKINLTEEEIEILVSLVEAEKATVRFLAGFAKPNEMEKKKEEFCDNLLEKLSTKQ